MQNSNQSARGTHRLNRISHALGHRPGEFGTTIVHRQDNTDAAPDMSNYQVKRLCQRQGDARPIKNVSHDEVLQRFQHQCHECPCLAILVSTRAA